MGTTPFYFDLDGHGLGVFLGSIESRLMELVWSHESLTVKRARFLLGPDSGLAYTTIMTVLNRLVEKELLGRTREGRNYQYHPMVSRDEFLQRRVGAVLDCLRANFPALTAKAVDR